MPKLGYACVSHRTKIEADPKLATPRIIQFPYHIFKFSSFRLNVPR